MPFPLIAAILASAAGIGSAAIGSKAAGSAAKAQSAAELEAAKLSNQATKDALKLQKQQYNSALTLSKPFLQLSGQAAYRLSDMMGFGRDNSPLPYLSENDDVSTGNDQPHTTRLQGPSGNFVDSPSVEQTNFLISQGYKPTGVSVAPQGGQAQNITTRDWNAISKKYGGAA